MVQRSNSSVLTVGGPRAAANIWATMRARGGKVDEDGVYAVASDESAGFADNFLERRRCGVPGQAVFSDQKLL